MTPTLNQGRFIEQTIRSLMAQSFGDFEHIVVDGGSTDETHEILRRYESRYPMRWSSGTDQGMYDAINKGLASAEGAIHAYLNSDDLYFPWTLQVVADRMALTPALDLLYGDAINIDDESRDQHFRLFPGFDLDRLQYIWPLPQPAAFWRRSVTTELSGFDVNLKYVGDWDFFIRAGKRVRIAKVNEFLAIERRHLASKTLGEADPMAIETTKMLQGHARYDVSTARRATVKAKALAARRATWIRFVREARRDAHEHGAPWSKLLSSTKVHVDAGRLIAGMIPGTPYRWKVGAVRADRDWLQPR